MVYKFERYIVFIAFAVLVSALPAISIVDIVSDGKIDPSSVTKTRMELPLWILYLIGWSLWIFIYFWAFIPVIKYLWRGYIFKLHPGAIFIDGTAINRNEVHSWRETMRGLRLETNSGVYFFHPRLSGNGLNDFLNFIDNKIEHKF